MSYLDKSSPNNVLIISFSFGFKSLYIFITSSVGIPFLLRYNSNETAGLLLLGFGGSSSFLASRFAKSFFILLRKLFILDSSI